MEDVLGESLAQQRFSATLLGFFAVAALALAVLGLYGVISFGVARRSRGSGSNGARRRARQRARDGGA